ncbi:type IV pilus modification protein PilV [Saccharophagus sp. K07]|mgnify:CR=1 FL=1|jgi:type IV pilus assembly protein PilV|uniref:type IV pilus modification protein PilV n=1 Tax=Saccharophagus sp. K07 TaxID=2283636 RepID=UPI001651C85D|nr:type IV pilus modification protein PilV [Saccharophagus sp. K07]MBC6904637.1 type IV pilus modification protein PilV [Saccharophagus sp. K07]
MNRLRRNEVGSSLVEVVVALFVLAVGMLGVLSMQVKSMQFNQSAYYYTQAVYLANEILEHMRSSPGIANTYLIGLEEAAPTASKNCNDTSVTCSPAELRNFNLKQWRDNVTSTLVSGKASVQRVGDFYAITVQFDDSRSSTKKDGTPELSEYVLMTEI